MKKLLLLVAPLLLLFGFTFAVGEFPVNWTQQEQRQRRCRPLPADYYTNVVSMCNWNFPNWMSDWEPLDCNAQASTIYGEFIGENPPADTTYINPYCYTFLNIAPPIVQQPDVSPVTDPQDPRRMNEVQSAITWMYSKHLTSYDTVATFQPAQNITREQASKFYGMFARDIIWKSPNPGLPCTFSDINQADPTLVDSITLACKLGLFKWYNGKFDPKWKITVNASQTVFIRSIVWMLPEIGANYWDAYAAKWYEMWIFGHRTRDKDLEPRWSIAIYMFEYSHPEYRNHQNQDGQTSVQDF